MTTQPIGQTSEKEEAILQAALTLFTERGYHGTAVPLIAAEAGVGAGTIYRYFGSKEELVNDLYRRCKTTMSGAILKDFPFDGAFREQFHHFWQGWAAWAEENPKAFSFLELHHHASYLDEESLAMERRLIGLTEQIIKRGQELGTVKPIAPLIVMGIIYGLFIGVVRAHRELGEQLTQERLEIAEDCCWEAIRA